MPDANRSSLATQVKGVRNPKSAIDRGKPYGALYHTTGRGIVTEAKADKKTPLAVALETYIASQNGSNGYFWGGPHYVIDHDGSRHQIAPDNALTAHAGGDNRSAYLSGYWETKVSPATLAAWRKQWWPRYKHPYSLFPSKSPNHDYVGIEMIACGAGFGTPMRAGLLFTKAQHDSAIALADDLAQRHGWPKGWAKGARLVGHEDVDILNRMDARGGWDPGWLRAKPYFDFGYVRGAVK
jgi:N-acetylmuramoyl-L-alanine amidase